MSEGLPVDEFVRARLAEDEMLAREAGTDVWQPGDRWRLTPCGRAWSAQRDDDVLEPAGGGSPAVMAHVVRHDPGRVLEDVDAKRTVHDAYRRAKPGSVNRSGLGIALRALACAWADHPDFDPAWRG